MKAILAVAVLAMAAFAGVMIVGDDADAADDVVKYKVSYVYGDNIMVETVTATDGVATVQLKIFADVFSGVNEPTGYSFAKWKIGSSIYAAGTNVDITGDVTVNPTFDADSSIVKLVYGDITAEYLTDGSVTAYVPTVGDLKDFAKKIGAKLVIDRVEVTLADTEPITDAMSLFILGSEFKGFFNANDNKVDFADITGAASASVTTYKAVFEPVYNVSFVVEGATVLEINSDKISLNDERTVPIAPIKDNYIFMGWYDAAGEKIIGYSIDKDEYTYAAGDDFKFTEDIVLYAKFVPVTFTVTFVYGEEKTVFTTETVKYGNLAIEPKGLPEGYKGWDWSFGTKIIADTEIVAIVADPVTVYNVTFEIDGKAPVTQRSDSMVLPDTKIEGKVFQGWVVKGASQYVDPMTYEITGDITFVAVYKEADPPAGPGFFETTTGQCVAVIIAVVIIALIYAVATNMFGLKDALTSVKIMRVKK